MSDTRIQTVLALVAALASLILYISSTYVTADQLEAVEARNQLAHEAMNRETEKLEGMVDTLRNFVIDHACPVPPIERK